jgi:hypothetical protein
LLAGVDVDAADDFRKKLAKVEPHVNQKNVRQIHNWYKEIQDKIGSIQENTAKELWR